MSESTTYLAPKLTFLSEEFHPDSFEAIKLEAEKIISFNPSSVAEWENWVLWRSEWESVIAEESLNRMYASVCRTNDADLEKAHLEYQTEILPKVQSLEDALDRKYLKSPFREELANRGLFVYDRSIALGVELFREENIPLQAEEEKLSSEYTRTIGAMTVEFEGEEMTLPAMTKYLESPIQKLREKAFRLTAKRRLQDKDRLNDIFQKMLDLRHQIALNAGFDNYRDYMHRAKERFDYTPKDCQIFGDNVKRYVLPILKSWNKEREKKLGLKKIRPWDTAVDPSGANAFEPFKDTDQHVGIAAQLMSAVSPQFGSDLKWLYAQGLLDLDTRPHKGPGGFMDNLEKRRVPVIFANSGTTHSDIETLVHEGGHAINGLLSRHLEPMAYRNPPLEFAEVASMGLEAMAMEHLGEVYPEKEVSRVRRDSLEGMLSTFSWVAIIDGFQQWLYTNPGHNLDERTSAWLDICESYNPGVDWSGLEEEYSSLWHRTLHLFQVPFYYIEYAIAQMGAIQLWLNYKNNQESCVKAYCSALSLGGSKTLPELFSAAGLSFDPQGEGLQDWAPAVAQERSALL